MARIDTLFPLVEERFPYLLPRFGLDRHLQVFYVEEDPDILEILIPRLIDGVKNNILYLFQIFRLQDMADKLIP